MKFYWHEVWVVVVGFAVMAGFYVESIASEYNGHWSWTGFGLIFVLFLISGAALQGILWSLDQI